MADDSKGRKKIDRVYIEHVAQELDVIVKTKFDGNQTRAAEALGLSQPHLSHLIRALEDRGPGLLVLLLLRQYSGRSIDSLLGLPPIEGSALQSLHSEQIDALVREAIERHVAQRSARVNASVINSAANLSKKAPTRARAHLQKKKVRRKKP